MQQGIAIFGLNGSGKSTLTHALAEELNYYEMDVEDYYFPHQKAARQMSLKNQPSISKLSDGIPFSNSKTKADVQCSLLEDMQVHPHFILCSVAMNWCDEILSRIDIAFWIQTPQEERLRRIQQRELFRFGDRVLPGGDMYEQQKAFREAVALRDPKSLEENALRLGCPVYSIDGSLPVQENIQHMLHHLSRHDTFIKKTFV